MKNIYMYYKQTCPYCSKVLRYLDEHKIRIPLKNILENPEIRGELVRIGGKSQVPCLVIDEKPLYESDDIIQWFKDNWKEN